MLLILKILKRNRPGFSLAEILVAVSIIALLAAVVTSNYSLYDRTKGLHMAIQVLASDIRRTQSFGLNLKEHQSGVIPSGGWGIRLSSQNPNNESYILFAEFDEDGYYTSASGEVYEELKFAKPGASVVSQMTVDGTPYQYVNIIFKPPGPTVTINGGDSATTMATVNADSVTIEVGMGADTRTILVNKFGLVDVQ